MSLLPHQMVIKEGTDSQPPPSLITLSGAASRNPKCSLDTVKQVLTIHNSHGPHCLPKWCRKRPWHVGGGGVWGTLLSVFYSRVGFVLLVKTGPLGCFDCEDSQKGLSQGGQHQFYCAIRLNILCIHCHLYMMLCLVSCWHCILLCLLPLNALWSNKMHIGLSHFGSQLCIYCGFCWIIKHLERDEPI